MHAMLGSIKQKQFSPIRFTSVLDISLGPNVKNVMSPQVCMYLFNKHK